MKKIYVTPHCLRRFIERGLNGGEGLTNDQIVNKITEAFKNLEPISNTKLKLFKKKKPSDCLMWSDQYRLAVVMRKSGVNSCRALTVLGLRKRRASKPG